MPARSDADHARDRRNRAFWNEHSDTYQRAHQTQLDLQREQLRWGVWSVPDVDLGVLGSVHDKDVLELGCGSADTLVALTRDGARAVGLELSDRQLAHARRVLAATRCPAQLVQGSAEVLPFRDGTFDVVMADNGVATLARPEAVVAEAARVLRPKGIFALCLPSPLVFLTWSGQTGKLTGSLQRPYFGMSNDRPDQGGGIAYQRTYGDWVRLLRRHNLIVEDLVEINPPQGITTTFRSFDAPDWARRFPTEMIWKTRRVGTVPRRRSSRKA